MYTICDEVPPSSGAIGDFTEFKKLNEGTKALLAKIRQYFKDHVDATKNYPALLAYKHFRWMAEATKNNISYSEFARGLQRMSFGDLSPSTAKKCFHYIDVDDDGTVSFSDFAKTFFNGKVLLCRADLVTPSAGALQQKSRDMNEYAKTIKARMPKKQELRKVVKVDGTISIAVEALKYGGRNRVIHLVN